MEKYTDRFKTRPLSHSQLSSWEYDKESWYKSYVLGEKFQPTPAMIYGNVIGDLIGTPESPIPELKDIGIKEYKLTGSVGDIQMIGFVDGYNPETLTLHENKTSDNPKRWNQKKVDEHTQLDMYLLLLWLSQKIRPEDVKVFLNFIPVERDGSMLYTCPGTFKQFETRRTGVDLLKYATYITDTVKAMEKYGTS